MDVKLFIYKNEKIVKQLSGHSGCYLYLVSNANMIYVRKVSHNINYNFRLEKQMFKQKNFSHALFKTPMIYKHGYIEGKFYFDMEYISGNTLDKIHYTLDEIDIDELIKSISISNVAISLNDILNNDLIVDKISKIINHKNYIYTEMADHLVRKILDHDFEKIPRTNCHGDLTLENIIYQNELYLIDFLDSFVESYLIDYAKLLQDVFLNWSYRYDNHYGNFQARNSVIKLKLDKHLIELDETKYYLKSTYLLLSVNILRIVPYLKDQKTIKWLNESIKKLLEVV